MPDVKSCRINFEVKRADSAVGKIGVTCLHDFERAIHPAIAALLEGFASKYGLKVSTVIVDTDVQCCDAIHHNFPCAVAKQ
jgi:hypothetical protein